MKLYKSILEQIYKTNLTKKELDTLLFLLQVQDDFGTIVNVHWNEIATKIHMVAQSFYNCVSGLEAKGFITTSNICPNGHKNYRGLHTIQIIVPSAPEKPQTTGGIVSQIDLQEYIKGCGPYLNLKEYSLINTNTFRGLKADAKKVVLNFMWRHQGTIALYGHPGIKSYDLILTLEGGADLCGFEWHSGRKGAVVRRKMKRYFEDIISSNLLPITQDGNFTLHWALDDMHYPLLECHIHADIPDADTDSIADTTNRRTIYTVLKQKGISSTPEDMQNTLTLFDEQYRGISGMKMLVASVKDIITDCVKSFAALIPSYINKKCREVLGLAHKGESPEFNLA